MHLHVIAKERPAFKENLKPELYMLRILFFEMQSQAERMLYVLEEYYCAKISLIALKDSQTYA